MRIFLSIILLLFFIQASNAQYIVKLYEDHAYFQKLEKEWQEAQNDSIKALKSLELSYAYKRSKNLEKSKSYLDVGLKLSAGNPYLLATSTFYQAYYRLGSPEYKEIENQFLLTDSLLSSFQNPEAFKLRSMSWMSIGVLEQIQGHEDKGLDAYLEHALPLAQKSKDQFTEGNAAKFVAVSLLNANERLKANGYLTKAFHAFRASKIPSEAQRQETLVEITLLLAENNIYLNRLQDCKNYLDEAYDIIQKYPESMAFQLYYYPEGIYYEKQGLLQQAIQSFDKGIGHEEDEKGSYVINRLKYAKFMTLRRMGRNKEAISLMLGLLKSNVLFAADRNSYYNLLAQTYAAEGNMSQAYSWSQKYILINDSLQVSTYKAKMMELENKYQTIAQEKQINQLQSDKQKAELNQKNQRLLNWLLGAGIVLFLLTILILMSVIKNSKKTNSFKLRELEQKKELQITHAFMDGEEKERQRMAQDLHDGLGGTLASLKIRLSGAQADLPKMDLDSGILQLDTAIQELRRIARNMMPASLLRSGLPVALADLCSDMSNQHLFIELQADGLQKNLPSIYQINIYRIIQELLANAVRHGQPTQILVQVIQNEKQILITVEDDGKGFNQNHLDQIKGIGLSNIRNRVNLLKGKMEVESSPDNGAAFHIELYLPHSN